MNPTTPTPPGGPPADPYDTLVDGATGVVNRLWPADLPSFAPPGLRLWLAMLSGTGPLVAPRAADTTTGCAWWDTDAARAAALGEAVEWYAGCLVPDDLETASAGALRAAGRSPVAPQDVVGYTPQQLTAPGFPFTAFTDDLPVRWAAGCRLADDRPLLVPASLVYLGYGMGPTSGEPLTNLSVSGGIAAGTSPAATVAAALAEVVERDALAAAWTFGLPLDPLAVPDTLAGTLGGDDTTRWTFHRLPTVIDVPGILAVVRHGGTGVVGVGAAVRDDPVAAARKAAAEAVVSAAAAIELDTPGSPSAARHVEGGAVRPWRADRAYTGSYRTDWHDAIDIVCHLQIYLDPVMQDRLDRRLAALSAGRPEVALGALPSVAGHDTWPQLLLDAGYDPVAVDLTPTDVASLGWYVTRCVVPGLRTTGPAAFPALGAARRPGRGPVYLDPVPHA